MCLDAKTNDDADDHETHNSENDTESESVSNSKAAEDDEEEIFVLENHVFPDFAPLINWGLFAEPSDRLQLIKTSDGNKG